MVKPATEFRQFRYRAAVERSKQISIALTSIEAVLTDKANYIKVPPLVKALCVLSGNGRYRP